MRKKVAKTADAGLGALVQLRGLFLERNALGSACRAEDHRPRVLQRGRLLRVGQLGAAVLAPVGELLDRPFLEVGH
jgi:hypothetical protein